MKEYIATYIRIPHFVGPELQKKGLFKPSVHAPESAPDMDALLQAGDYQNHLNEMSQQGFSLHSITPVLRGQYHAVVKDPSYGLGFSITDGFQLMWERELEGQAHG